MKACKPLKNLKRQPHFDEDAVRLWGFVVYCCSDAVCFVSCQFLCWGSFLFLVMLSRKMDLVTLQVLIETDIVKFSWNWLTVKRVASIKMPLFIQHDRSIHEQKVERSIQFEQVIFISYLQYSGFGYAVDGRSSAPHIIILQMIIRC